MYPNPTKGDVTINLPADIGKSIRVALFDERGGECGNLKYSLNEEKLHLQIQNEPNGIYFIRVESKNFYQSYKLTLLK